MLYMFTILVAIMDSVLASGQPLSDVWHKSTTLKTVRQTYGKRALGRGKTKVNRTVNAVHPKMALQKDLC